MFWSKGTLLMLNSDTVAFSLRLSRSSIARFGHYPVPDIPLSGSIGPAD